MVVSNNVDANKQFITNAERNSQCIQAKVTKVIDGDTIIINTRAKEERVRLILVDTPETKHPQIGVQPFEPEANDYNNSNFRKKYNGNPTKHYFY